MLISMTNLIVWPSLPSKELYFSYCVENLLCEREGRRVETFLLLKSNHIGSDCWEGDFDGFSTRALPGYHMYHMRT